MAGRARPRARRSIIQARPLICPPPILHYVDPGIEVIAADTPAHGVTLDILGEPSTISEGGVTMSLHAAAGLADVLRQLDAEIPF